MGKKLILVSIVLVLFLLLLMPVSASDLITIKEKRISGNDGGGVYGGALFILKSDTNEDYIVSFYDYASVHVGDNVSLVRDKLCWKIGNEESDWWFK